MAIIHNITAPESTSKKNHNSIANQFIRDGVARSESLVAFVRSQYNLTDGLIKYLPQLARELLFKICMHDIYDRRLKTKNRVPIVPLA